MALRERTNSASKLIHWIKDSFGAKEEKPKALNVSRRATSTPHKNSPDYINDSLDLSVITPPYIDFAELGAFGPDKHLGHPDFDIDITSYSFHIQAISPNTRAEWAYLGGEVAYKKLILFIYDLYVEKPMPREVLYLAVYYMQSLVKKENITQKDLEDAAVAAVNLAAKIERQHGFRFAFLEEYDLKNVFVMEKKICSAVGFSLWPSTVPFFMRLLNNIICVGQWHWTCAKCLAELMICRRELAETPPSLAAGVALRLVSILDQKDLWNENCYTIIQHTKEEYIRPHFLLCSLILSALETPRDFEAIFYAYGDIFRILKHKQQIIEGEIKRSQFHSLT